MRVRRVKGKDRRLVSIPDDLRESLREVAALLVKADADPDISLDFDDAIQVGALCGGRCGPASRPFTFTYFPSGDWTRRRWYLSLHRTEIEDIAEGRMAEILMYCCRAKNCQCKFRDESYDCFYCDWEDEEVVQRFEAQLNELAKRVESKEEWIKGYVALNPEASVSSVIVDYNPIRGLGERLGWFTVEEVETLLDQHRRQTE